MKKVILQVLVVLVGLSGLNAGIFSSCKKSLVEKALKGKISVKDKDAIRKCVNDKMAQENPNFTQALVKACDSAKFKRDFKKQCEVARKVDNPDEEDSSGGDSSSGKSSTSSDGDNHDSSSGDKTCTCICQTAPQMAAPSAYQGYAPQPSYDPYGGYQQQPGMQQYQQQYQQPGYGY